MFVELVFTLIVVLWVLAYILSCVDFLDLVVYKLG